MSDFIGPLTRHLGRQPASKRNRRRQRRLPTRLPTARVTLPGGETFAVQVRNLSLLGIGLASGYAIPEGLRVRVLLVNRSHIFLLSIDFEVVHCGRQNGDTFSIGGRFCRPLSFEELAPFVR
jgi:hypothetical protein